MHPRQAFSRCSYYFSINYNRHKLLKHGATIGSNLLIYNSFYLKGNGKIKIGDNVKITSGSGINPISRNIRASIFVGKTGSLIIGDNVGMSSPCIRVKQKIEIGNNVKIGALCEFIDTDVHSMNYQIRNMSVRGPKGESIDGASSLCAPIKIEDDVWIGMHCIILKGVTIGARSIIGAGSVVTKSIPSDCVAAGNPCKVIRYLNQTD